jgi:hypothetical protein
MKSYAKWVELAFDYRKSILFGSGSSGLGQGIKTAGVQGMAAQQAFGCQPGPFAGAVLPNGFIGVAGAGRLKTA